MVKDMRNIIIHDQIFYFMTFDEVYKKYNKLCKSIAYKFTNKFNTFDDLICISNYSMFKAFENYNSDKNISFISYLGEITKNDFLLNKRQENKINKESSLDLFYSFEDDINYIDFINNENLMIKINDLIPTYRSIIILFFFYGYKQVEIAKFFNVDRSTISRRLKNALRIMGANL